MGAGSPAIDAGDNTLAVDADNNPLATDQRGTGFDRIIDGTLDSTATVDIGAFEAATPPDSFIVTTATDENDGSANPAMGAGTSLREAIIAANANANHSTITFAAGLNGSRIVLTIAGSNENASATGDLDITSEITITGNGESNTIIDAGGMAGLGDRVLHVYDGGNLTVNASTIKGGDNDGHGGGVLVHESASLSVMDSTISNNYAFHGGGGISAEESTSLSIANSTITGNTAGGEGGGLYIEDLSTLSLTDSSVTDNEAGGDGGGINVRYETETNLVNSTISGNASNGGNGGGVYSYGTLNIVSSTITGNSTTRAGGGIYSDGPLTLTDSVVSGNTAERVGGGVSTRDISVIRNSSITNNTATSSGGGLYNDGTATVTNSTISGNSAGTFAGGIYNFGSVNLVNSTVTGNSAVEHSAGIYNSAPGAVGNLAEVNITNSTIAFNTGAAGISSLARININNSIVAGHASGDLEILTDTSNTGTFEGASNLVQDGSDAGTGLTGTVNADPLLGPLQDNGGLTETHALAAGSVAIDAGDDYLALDDAMDMLLFDQRGPGFDRINGPSVDIGAFEFDGPPEPPESSIIDNSDPGYSNVGSWTTVNRNGHEGGFGFAPAGNGSSVSTWAFSVPAGQYRVSATWRFWTNRATNAPYTVNDGSTALSTMLIDQQQAPTGVEQDGSTFQELGIFSVTSGQLLVELSNDANGLVSADAILVEQIGVTDPGPEINVSVGGVGVQDDSTFDFGSAMQGAIAERTFTVDNLGDQDLIVQPITVPAGFTLVSPNFTPNQVIAPGGSVSFTLQTDTSSQGTLSGEVTFDHNDTDETPFNFTVTAEVGPAIAVIDNSSGSGFATSGSFTTVNRNGHLGNFVFAQANSSATATYTFNVAPGDYRVSAAWRQHTNRTTDAQYVITDTDTATDLATVNLNQRNAPTADVTVAPGGPFDRFQDLGTVTVAGNVVTITLSNIANDGLLIADAIRLERVD